MNVNRSVNSNDLKIFQILAKAITDEIALKIQGSYFTIMADESADASNQEQAALCLRWVDEETLCANEEFVGIESILSCTS